MILRPLLLAICFKFSFGLVLPLQAMAGTDARAASGELCRLVADRVARLSCFDQAFDTPLPVAAATGVAAIMRRPAPYAELIRDIASKHSSQQADWSLRYRPWGEDRLYDGEKYADLLASQTNRPPAGNGAQPHQLTEEAVDIFMTRPDVLSLQNGKSDGEAILLLSCENNITTMGVLLPKPIRALQARLSLSGTSGMKFKLNWRDFENGNFIIAGRGLESIDTIKAIATDNRIQLQVDFEDGPRAFLFEIGDLKNQLRPLRTACHW